MVSVHASPLAAPGAPGCAGQSVYIAELSRALGAAGHRVTVWTRRDDPTAPHTMSFARGVTVRHVDAGPARWIPRHELVPQIPQTAAALARAWAADRPDVVHVHFWTSGLAAAAAAGRVAVPLVQTFHALAVIERRLPGGSDHGAAGRVGAERVVGRRADAVVATCAEEASELVAMGVPRSQVSVVPCGVDVDAFTPHGPVSERRTEVPRLVSVGTLERPA